MAERAGGVSQLAVSTMILFLYLAIAACLEFFSALAHLLSFLDLESFPSAIAKVYSMMRRMTGGQGKGWRDARQKVMEALRAKVICAVGMLLAFIQRFILGPRCIILHTQNSCESEGGQCNVLLCFSNSLLLNRLGCTAAQHHIATKHSGQKVRLKSSQEHPGIHLIEQLCLCKAAQKVT